MKTLRIYITGLLLLIAFQVHAQISREEAYELAKTKLTELSMDDIDIFASKQMLPAKTEVNANSKTIISPYVASWLFFVDENPLQNWGHSCQYVFVDVNKNISIHPASFYPISPDILNMDVLHMHKAVVRQGEYSPLVDSSIEKAPKAANATNMNNFYAVIINGGNSKLSNHIRYWNDCSYIYKTLINKYHYNSSNIYVLMSDGTSPAEDRRPDPNKLEYDSSPTDLNGDGIADIDYSATKENIINVFNTLSSKLTSNDYLFIFVTDHGGIERAESFMCTWNSGKLFASEFAAKVKAINTKATNIVLGQCNSGGFTKYFEGSPNICIATACMDIEESYSMSNLQYDEFLYRWTFAVNNSGDFNGDGHISAKEAFDYAVATDIQNETPQFYGVEDFAKKLALDGMFTTTYPDYINGYCMVNGLRRSFYTSDERTDYDPEFGVPMGAKIDINLTEPNVPNQYITWSVTEGSNNLNFSYLHDKNSHIEIRSQAELGSRTVINVEISIPQDSYYVARNLKFYVTSSYYIARTSTDVLSIEKKQFDDLPMIVPMSTATIHDFNYQIIETSTGIVRMSGSYPIDQRLELDVSSLRSGIYTVIVTENGEVKAQQNISL